jgi:hypothetical protein
MHLVVQARPPALTATLPGTPSTGSPDGAPQFSESAL